MGLKKIWLLYRIHHTHNSSLLCRVIWQKMKFLFNYCVSLLKKYLLHLSRPVSFIIIQKYSGKKWIFFVYYHVMCKVLCIQHASNVSIIIQTQTKNHFDVKKYFFSDIMQCPFILDQNWLNQN